MYTIVLFIPLFNFLFIACFASYLGRLGAVCITLLGMLVTFSSSLFIFFEVALSNTKCLLNLYSWIRLEFINVEFTLLFDNLTAIMCVVVTFISLLVHIYSFEYMYEDPCLPRFMSYLSLFTFFMLLFVTSGNMLQMFVGWEGVGLASYLLINFWYTRMLANKAGLFSMILNRIGDFGLMTALIGCFFFFGTFDYSVIFSLAPYMSNQTFILGSYNINILEFICIFIFLGAVGKSAQLGLHTWLPYAMEGPTPVSALIHAATMVTAGIFLIIRCSFIFEYTSYVLLIMAGLGSLTCCLFAVVGTFQYDLKKIIAYSTCSQLGYMTFSCGLSNYYTAMFHLFNHAFFKALLFLSAGAVIHAISNEQDIRRMGGLVKILPFIYICFTIGSFAIMGFPFLTGFYSKEYLLEFAFGRFDIISLFAYFLGILAALFTSIYSWKIVYWVFLTKTNMYQAYLKHIHEPGWFITIPLFILALASVFFGYIFSAMVLETGFLFWNNSIFVYHTNNFFFEAEDINMFAGLAPLLVTITGFIIFFFFNIHDLISKVYYKNYFFNCLNIKLHQFFTKSLMFDQLLIKLLTKFLNLSQNAQKLDNGLFELSGPILITWTLKSLNKFLKTFSVVGLFYDFFVYIIFFAGSISYMYILVYFLNFKFMFIIFFFVIINFFFLFKLNWWKWENITWPVFFENSMLVLEPYLKV